MKNRHKKCQLPYCNLGNSTHNASNSRWRRPWPEKHCVVKSQYYGNLTGLHEQMWVKSMHLHKEITFITYLINDMHWQWEKLEMNKKKHDLFYECLTFIHETMKSIKIWGITTPPSQIKVPPLIKTFNINICTTTKFTVPTPLNCVHVPLKWTI